MADEEVVRVPRLTRWQRIGIAVLFLLVALLLGGGVFIFSGIYNIAASREHWTFTNFLITVLRERSIAVAASGIKVPDLGDPALRRLGAEHYRGGCATCHGMPGQPQNPIYGNMLPSPPDLTNAFADYEPRELHWIIENGLKYTGMPAWSGDGRSDEVWSVVAYLASLQEGIQPAKGGEEPALALTADLAGAATVPLENCVRCHGAEGTSVVSDLVPMLHALPQAYLERALREYRQQVRDSGIMAPVAHEMTETELVRFAQYYAGLPPVSPALTAMSQPAERGRQIAEQGIPERDVPACVSCHNGSNPQVPPLLGQSAQYMANQLELWQDPGFRSTSPFGSLMAIVGRRLTDEDAEAVSAWYGAGP